MKLNQTDLQEELENVPEWGKDDFFTEAPYLWLMDFNTDKFLYECAKQKMFDRAKSVKVNNAAKLLNTFLLEHKDEYKVKIEMITDFPNQPMQLISGRYDCDNDVRMNDIPICLHPIMPVRRLINADNGAERLEIAFLKGDKWRTIIEEKSTIANSSKILQLAEHGVVVNSDNAKQLSSYLMEIEQINYNDIPEQCSIGRLGWIANYGFSPYIKDLVFDGEQCYKGVFDAVKSKGTLDGWLVDMIWLRHKKSYARYLLAASFASALVEPCGALPFFFHLYGEAACGKTVALMVAASVWGNPVVGELITTFNSTNVGLEMLASFCNSIPLCIDELQIQANSNVDFDKIIYFLSESTGRTRGSKYGGLQRRVTWHNCFITTGEMPITRANSGGGAMARVLEVECDEPVANCLPDLANALKGNYGHAGKLWVEWLQVPENMEKVKAKQKDFFRQLLDKGAEDKQAASASLLLTADYYTTELFFDGEDAMTIDEAVKLCKSKNEVNVNLRILEFIYDFVSEHIQKFNVDFDRNCDVWGKIEGGYIYIIKSVFDRELSNVGFHSGSFLRWAKRQGLLKIESSRRCTYKAQIVPKAGAVNTVCIKKRSEREP